MRFRSSVSVIIIFTLVLFKKPPRLSRSIFTKVFTLSFFLTLLSAPNIGIVILLTPSLVASLNTSWYIHLTSSAFSNVGVWLMNITFFAGSLYPLHMKCLGKYCSFIFIFIFFVNSIARRGPAFSKSPVDSSSSIGTLL